MAACMQQMDPHRCNTLLLLDPPVKSLTEHSKVELLAICYGSNLLDLKVRFHTKRQINSL